MWWKLYFWIITILIVLSLFVGIDFSKSTFMDWAGLLVSIPSLVGLFIYAYNKNKFLSVKIWQIVFWLTIFMDSIGLILASTHVKEVLPLFLMPQVTNYTNPTEAIIGTILELPVLYVLYQLSFNLAWYSKQEENSKLNLVNTIKTGWWKLASILLVIYGFLYLLALTDTTNSIASTSSEEKITTAVIGIFQISIGILLWYRVNLALLLSAVYFIFRAVALLVCGSYGEFIFNTIVLIVLFVLILKTHTKLTQN